LSAEWAPQRLIGRISPRPLLLIGGTDDDEIPAAMARDLYAAARDPKTLWIVPGARHGGYARAAPLDYPQRLVSFYIRYLVENRS